MTESAPRRLHVLAAVLAAAGLSAGCAGVGIGIGGGTGLGFGVGVSLTPGLLFRDSATVDPKVPPPPQVIDPSAPPVAADETVSAQKPR